MEKKNKNRDLVSCYKSGEILHSGERGFVCLQCKNSFKIEFRFNDKPICQNCAVRSGISALLDCQNDQLVRLAEKTSSKTINMLGEGLQQNVEEAINRAIQYRSELEKYKQQHIEFEQQIDDLKVYEQEAKQLRQRAENAERELQKYQQRKLNEQEIMELEGFRDNGDGTVTQLGTNLTWMRFSFGQYWFDGRVTGEPNPLNFKELQQHIGITNKKKWLSKSNWRLPTIEELKSIIRRQNRPTVNREIFPGITDGDYWSGTKGSKSDKNLFIYFRDGRYGETDNDLSWILKLAVLVAP